MIVAALACACAVGDEAVLDGGPISGSIDLGRGDLTTGFDDPIDAALAEATADAPHDEALDASTDVVTDDRAFEDRADAQTVIDLGGCAGACAPGASRACGNCGRQTCGSECAWGACSGSGACAPGQRRAGSCDACSEQVCSGACQWGGCQLRGGAACEYRSGRNTRSCSRCRCGLQWCLATCQWSTDCTSCCTTCGGCQ